MTMGEFDVASTGTKNPNWPGGVKARAASLNAAGGINGRKVKVLECNLNLDPNEATKCARSAVSNKVAAVVFGQIVEEQQVFPVLEAAGIPVIGAFPNGPLALGSKVSFPISAGVPGMFSGMAVMANLQGLNKQAFAFADIGPVAQGARDAWEGGVKASGGTVTNVVPVPPDATDLGPIVAALTKDDPQAITPFLLGAGQGQILQALRKSGTKASLVSATAFLTPQLIKALGKDAEGILVLGHGSVRQGSRA
jgi:ABC-type branched-subunit amino acid transport system substrate-binding protein